MTYRAGGRARRLPLVGSAIVGAVLLVRSDKIEPPEPPFDDPAAPDLARFSVVLDLPKPRFGAARVSASRAASGDGTRSQHLSPPLADIPQAVLAVPQLSAGPGLVARPSAAAAPGGTGSQLAADEDFDRVVRAELTGASAMKGSKVELAAASGTIIATESTAAGEVSGLASPMPSTGAYPFPAFTPPTVAPPQGEALAGLDNAAAEQAPSSAHEALADQAQAAGVTGPAEPDGSGGAATPARNMAGSWREIVQEALRGSPAVSTPASIPAPVSADPPVPDAAPAPVRLAVAMPGPDFSISARPPASAGTSPPPQESTELAVSPVSEAPFPPGAMPTFSYDDELILQIEVGKQAISDTLIAYGTRSGVYLPFGAVARLLDLSITVSDDGHFASGWFLSESRTMAIDLRQGTLTLAGKAAPLDRAMAIAFEGELYLRAEMFARILPLRLETNLRAQSVAIEPLELFPFQQRIERERERERLASRKGRDREKAWPRQDTPWRAFTLPLTDVEIRAASDSSQGERIEGDVRLAGDLAFMTARTYLSASTRDGLTGARVELGRRDPDAGLLGPLRATEFQLGDVATVPLPLGLRGIGGRGGAITNAPIDQVSLFDAIDLRGDLPEGYEVELFRNDVLIGSTRLPVNGQYEFLQVPVDFGLNVFRLVFYGPQGQRYQDVRRISVGDGRRKPGELVYAFGMAQKDVNLLDVRGPFDTRPPDMGSWRATGSVEYGVTSGLTAQLAGSWFQTDQGESWLAGAGIRTGLGATAIRADVGYQKGGGKTAQAGLGGKLAGITYALTHAEYSGRFIDEVRSFSSEFLDRASELNVNATMKLGRGDAPLFIPVSGRLRRLEFASGRDLTEAVLRASTRASGLILSQTFDYSRTSSATGTTFQRLVGGFDLGTLSGSRTQYRAGVTYDVLPRPKLQSASLQVDHAFDPRTLVSASVGHAFSSDDTRLGLSASRQFDNFVLSFNGDYGIGTGTYGATLRLGFGFGRNPASGRFFIDRPGISGGGALAIRAFRDRDADGLFGRGDEAMPDLRFVAGGQTATADNEGIVMLSKLGDGNRANYRVDLESLPDIALSPASEGISFVPRAGRIHESDFAVVALSDIEGTAYFLSGDRRRAVSGVYLELLDKGGRIAATTRTEGDGFYLFEQVRPGTYAIRLEPGQAARLGLNLPDEERVVIGAEADIVRNDLEIAKP